jgi:TPR repeat protein
VEQDGRGAERWRVGRGNCGPPIERRARRALPRREVGRFGIRTIVRMKKGCETDETKAELIAWWDICDRLAASEGRVEIMSDAIDAARECQHPDAQWLASLYPDGVGEDSEEVLSALTEYAEEKNDPCALYLAGGMSFDPALVDRAAELGFAPAQAYMAGWCTQHTSKFLWAQKAAAQSHPAGMFELGELLFKGRGCAEDKVTALAIWRESAELGHPTAQYIWGALGVGEDELQRVMWWGRSAARGNSDAAKDLVAAASKQLFEVEVRSPRVVFELGAAFKGHFGGGRVFGMSSWSAADDFALAQQCVELHDEVLVQARDAIACWLMLARRLGVSKDMRLLITRILWERRADWCKVASLQPTDAHERVSSGRLYE